MISPIKATAIPVKPYPAVNPKSSLLCTPKSSLIATSPARPPEIAITIMIVDDTFIPAYMAAVSEWPRDLTS